MTIASPAFGDLIDIVLQELRGWTVSEEQRTTLNGAITNSATSLVVADASQVSSGPLQIDNELMWVTGVNRTTNTITIAPWGRGYMDSAPATHNDQAMVISRPAFPRIAVTKAIQQTLYAVYPDLFQVKDDISNTVVPTQISYPVAADCDTVLHVGWLDPGPTGLEITARRWRFNTQTQKVDIFDPMAAGRTIRITYMAAPGQLSAETDLLSSTGLQDTTQDVLIYGACYRMIPALEVSRLQPVSIQQSNNAQLSPNGSAVKADQFYFGLYQQALQREALRLQKFWPTQSHLER